MNFNVQRLLLHCPNFLSNVYCSIFILFSVFICVPHLLWTVELTITNKLRKIVPLYNLSTKSILLIVHGQTKFGHVTCSLNKLDVKFFVF